MPIKYKIDILAALKEKGYTTTKIRKEKLLAESTLTKLRNNELINLSTLGVICRLLDCQPSDLVEYEK